MPQGLCGVVGEIDTLSEWKKANPSSTARFEIDKPDKWISVTP
jgi:hypothetical protein